ncbi:hypothetical protein RA29_18795 [Tateyamaria sp. ANG-S1]|nr:hypothetical protein RA29_18795 [Tateyamaria sp. ANG-S1]
MRIGCYHRRTSIKEAAHVLANERGPVADPDHVWFADELVDTPRSLWKTGEVMIFPAMNRVILNESEGTVVG